MNNLYGWNNEWQRKADETAANSPYQALVPGRITAAHRNLWKVAADGYVLSAHLGGNLRNDEQETHQFPTVGDWVLLQADFTGASALIRHVLARHTQLERKEAGARTMVQVMAANFDTLFLIMSLNYDFNVRRLERYATAAWDSGAAPVVVLSKRDLCSTTEAAVERAGDLVPGIPVIAVSAVSGEGMEALSPWLIPGNTIAVAGSSGVGKSTLLNALAGKEIAATQSIREQDAHGRHTTTHRELHLLESGILLLDMPGIREWQLWDSDDGLETAFSDIALLAEQCRFRDCSHSAEPGCAVQAALENNELEAMRWIAYQKLQKELRHLALKQDQSLQLAERKKWRKLTQQRRH